MKNANLNPNSNSHLSKSYSIDKLLQKPTSAEQLVMDHCPSCYETLKAGATDCSSCGVVLSHFHKVATEKRLKLTIGGLYHLTSSECVEIETAWSKVESFYYDSNLHSQFLYLCFRLKSLPYAVKKYNDRLLKDSLDDIASTMKLRAMTLASESLLGKSVDTGWVPSILMQALVRTLMVILVIGVCAGSVLMLTSVLTDQKFFFLAMGTFVTVSCLLSLLLLKRLP